MERYPVSCNKDCGAGCALEAHIEDGRLVKVVDNPNRTRFMQGCVKGYRMPEILYHGERLTSPMKRVGPRGGEEFVPVSWDEAYSLIEERLLRVTPPQVIRIGGSGSCRGALHNTGSLTKRFLSLLGDYTDTRGNYSCEVVDFINPYLFGTRAVGIDVRTVLDSSSIILWGFNPRDTRFGCETEQVLREAGTQGIPCHVIDPRHTDSVELCRGEWIGIRPGTDSYLAAALGYLCIERFPGRLNELDRFAIGHHEVADYLTGKVDGIAKTPELASARTGIPIETIYQLFEALAGDKPAALLPGLSLQRALGGENLQRLLVFIQLMAGNAGKRGGSIGGGQWNQVPKVRAGAIDSRTTANGVPVNRWADAFLEGRAGGYAHELKVIYNVGGNFITQSSDTTKVKKAFMKAEFVVTHEMFMTPTARYSDIILPVAMFPEREDLCFANSGHLFYSRQVVEPPAGVKTDLQIFTDLSGRLGFREAFTEGKTPEQWISGFLADSEIDDIARFKELGFHESELKPFVAFSDFFTDPGTFPLETPSGKIELVSEAYESVGGDRYPLLQEPYTDSSYPLAMVTPHPRNRIHSQHAHIESLNRLQDDTIWMNLEDASERKISHGDTVRVESPNGYTVGTVSLKHEIVRGTVSTCQGFWHRGDSLGDCNHLTSDVSTSPANGSRTHTIAVEVSLPR